MEISNASKHSIQQYKAEKHSASASIVSNNMKNSSSSELNVMFSKFKAKITFESFEGFNKQNSVFQETLSDKLLKAGKDILSPDSQESTNLFGDDGYWGVNKTSQRISEFVLKGAGEDIERLKAGREGMLQGFKDAEKAWGGKLPDISYETMEKSLEAIDEKIRELGGSVVDFSA
ncbi:conserved hypothetical protein [Desulfamplus magnetovallimortis]|uniref:Hydrogenase-4 component G n=1 Tax=Desulfamplus magnetovallimortis TaxID=1246637 RepID=A0A1W1HHC4_9BACT|nr:hypothetical protein [Desulfamplus magnetovallimortis]SLM31782.1 conserved hypothetical protein [Desulfamplus magnetovallimortis]